MIADKGLNFVARYGYNQNGGSPAWRCYGNVLSVAKTYACIDTYSIMTNFNCSDPDPSSDIYCNQHDELQNIILNFAPKKAAIPTSHPIFATKIIPGSYHHIDEPVSGIRADMLMDSVDFDKNGLEEEEMEEVEEEEEEEDIRLKSQDYDNIPDTFRRKGWKNILGHK